MNKIPIPSKEAQHAPQRVKLTIFLATLALLAAFKIAGCQKAAGFRARMSTATDSTNPSPPRAQGHLLTKHITINGKDRRYAIYIPPALGESARPLVFELHGGGVYIEDMTGESGHKTPYKLWMPLADAKKFIVVYPEGLDGAYGSPTWNDCRANASVSSTADDVQFISALIDDVSSTYHIDPNRIYASGTSNGGIMALRLAVALYDRIAAVAAIAAAMPDQTECGAPTHAVSILFMNGDKDNHLPYNGGVISNPPNPDYGTVFSTEESVHIWTTLNHTDKSPRTYHFPDISKTDQSHVVRYTYPRGKENTEVILYKVIGGGHAAPSIAERYSWLYERYFGKQNHDIEMTSEVWKFFERHPRVPQETLHQQFTPLVHHQNASQ